MRFQKILNSACAENFSGLSQKLVNPFFYVSSYFLFGIPFSKKLISKKKSYPEKSTFIFIFQVVVVTINYRLGALGFQGGGRQFSNRKVKRNTYCSVTRDAFCAKVDVFYKNAKQGSSLMYKHNPEFLNTYQDDGGQSGSWALWSFSIHNIYQHTCRQNDNKKNRMESICLTIQTVTRKASTIT